MVALRLRLQRGVSPGIASPSPGPPEGPTDQEVMEVISAMLARQQEQAGGSGKHPIPGHVHRTGAGLSGSQSQPAAMDSSAAAAAEATELVAAEQEEEEEDSGEEEEDLPLRPDEGEAGVEDIEAYFEDDGEDSEEDEARRILQMQQEEPAPAPARSRPLPGRVVESTGTTAAAASTQDADGAAAATASAPEELEERTTADAAGAPPPERYREMLYPCGRILHCVPMHLIRKSLRIQRRQERASAAAGIRPLSPVSEDEEDETDGPRWELVQVDKEAYTRIRLCPDVIRDHYVASYAQAIISIGQQLGITSEASLGPPPTALSCTLLLLTPEAEVQVVWGNSPKNFSPVLPLDVLDPLNTLADTSPAEYRRFSSLAARTGAQAAEPAHAATDGDVSPSPMPDLI